MIMLAGPLQIHVLPHLSLIGLVNMRGVSQAMKTLVDLDAGSPWASAAQQVVAQGIEASDISSLEIQEFLRHAASPAPRTGMLICTLLKEVYVQHPVTLSTIDRSCLCVFACMPGLSLHSSPKNERHPELKPSG